MPSEQQLSNVLSEFARTLVTDFPIQAILDHLVERIVDVLPITAAGVTLISPELDPRYVAASDGVGAAVRGAADRARRRAVPGRVPNGRGRRGPRPPRRRPVPELRAACARGRAWARCSPSRSVMASARLGALDLYRDTPGMLDADAMDAAQTLADVAAAYLLNAQARADLRDSSRPIPRERAARRAHRAAQPGPPPRTTRSRDPSGPAVGQDGRGPLRRSRPVQAGERPLRPQRRRRAAGGRRRAADRRCFVPGDTLARMSGDEFVILCEDLDEPAEVDAIAARIGDGDRRAVRPVGHRGRGHGQRRASPSRVGATSSPSSSSRTPTRRCTRPSARAVPGTRSSTCASSTSPTSEPAWSATCAAPRRGASCASSTSRSSTTGDGRITGVEALLRWDHPIQRTGDADRRSSPSPSSPDSSSTSDGGSSNGPAPTVTAGSRTSGPTTSRCRSTCRAHQLMSPDFAADVAEVLDRTETDPGLVTLEVTESVFVQDSRTGARRPRRAEGPRREARPRRLRDRATPRSPTSSASRSTS